MPKIDAPSAPLDEPAGATAEGLRAERAAAEVTPKVIEDAFLGNTAIGWQALASDTTGMYNTASGA